ncbi:MAG: hypothetical protein MRY57_02320 [Candidatus Pacebacteria bacterium]|nr:hypothetical protein [Candidatus Paceibacterota bacterium]
MNGQESFQKETEKMSLQEYMDEFHKARENFFGCSDYHDFLLKKIIIKAKSTDIQKLKPIADKDIKANGPNYLHNRLVAVYCQRIGVTLKELLEYRFILKEHYSYGYNFAIDFHIEHECFKDKSPIPAEDANVEYERYIPNELKKNKEDIDFWLVNTLLKKMAIKEDDAEQMYYIYKEIGHGFGMRRAASAIKK